ncbi:MAG: tRNA (adenosine(37)-N6)-threonylcarbamoyltransferase complex ATPase subunit type 1 TsaE [Actinobacteria bacterium]|nr:tRNA (adenosine(37)-N6)-threonylcarbamoyltransferase complex ATPase subunit type 1 TsaE [Actinomycetota bacterium]
MKLFLASLEDTARLAQVIAAHSRPRDMIVLAGEMGTGKTTFTQSFGRAIGVTDPITSPTFNLLHNYGQGRMALHHADLYRLERTGELADLGLDELQDSGGVIIVEWGDIVGNDLGDALIIRFAHSTDVDQTQVRTVEIDLRGQQWSSRWPKVCADLDTKFTKSVRG